MRTARSSASWCSGIYRFRLCRGDRYTPRVRPGVSKKPLSKSITKQKPATHGVTHLAPQTRLLGLSLGDRACLALGVALKVPVFTADKSWKKLRVGARI